MTIWQRAIAIILLTVFTPVSVLAGTSMRLCVGDNGHRAIEFVVAAQHHSPGDVVGAVHCDRSDSGQSIPDCSDAPLLSVAQNANISKQIKHSIPFDNWPAAVLVPVSYNPTSVANLRKHGFGSPLTIRRDAHLDVIRTVVLLI